MGSSGRTPRRVVSGRIGHADAIFVQVAPRDARPPIPLDFALEVLG